MTQSLSGRNAVSQVVNHNRLYGPGWTNIIWNGSTGKRARPRPACARRQCGSGGLDPGRWGRNRTGGRSTVRTGRCTSPRSIPRGGKPRSTSPTATPWGSLSAASPIPTCCSNPAILGRRCSRIKADHRRHAEIENAIRDLKYGVGLNHLPSGRFAANADWLAVQVLAHNLARWAARIGLGEQLVTTRTLRRRFFSMAGRLTRSARRLTLHLPRGWPWAEQATLEVVLQTLQ